MKNCLIILLLLSLAACVSGEYGAQPPRDEPQARLGWIYVSGQGSSDPNLERADEIATVRTYVFNDITDAAPVEFKEYNVAGAPGQISFQGVMGVRYNPSGSNNRKLLVFIVNEPPLMAAQFEAVKNLRQLEALQLKMSDFLDAQNLAVQPTKYMPMTGVLCTDKIYASFTDADNHKETVLISRAVAKVEVWMTTNLTGGLTMGAGSSVSLQNTLATSPLLYHKGGWRDVGSIQSPATGYAAKTWTATQSTALPQTTPVHVCTFFTPERTVGSHPLTLNIAAAVSGEGTRTGTAGITKLKDGTPITEIRRNARYKVTLNVKSNSITSEVEAWHDEQIETEL